jgi:hypothetical protein
MQRMGIFLMGYVLFVGCLLAAAWRLGVLASLGTFWTAVLLLGLLGLGLMVGVKRALPTRIELDQR